MGLHGVGHDQATKHVCQSYWTRILILKNLGYYIYILNFEKSIKWNKTLWGTEKSSIFILFCFFNKHSEAFYFLAGKSGCFPHPRLRNTFFFLRCPGKQPLYPPAKFSAEMSLLFSRVALCCERSKGKKKLSWTRLASTGSVSKLHN